MSKILTITVNSSESRLKYLKSISEQFGIGFLIHLEKAQKKRMAPTILF